MASTPTPASAPASSRSPFALLRRLYHWTLSWAESRWGGTALGLLAFSESVIFPIPPDLLVMALALGKPARAFRFALIATLASVAGALGGYALGLWLWPVVEQFFFQWVPGFTQENFRYVQDKFQQSAFLAIFAAAFTPVPYKVFAIASGVFEVGWGLLVVSSLLGRGLRFFAVAALVRWLGPPAKQFIDRHFNLLTILFFLLLVLGFWAIRRLL